MMGFRFPLIPVFLGLGCVGMVCSLVVSIDHLFRTPGAEVSEPTGEGLIVQTKLPTIHSSTLKNYNHIFERPLFNVTRAPVLQANNSQVAHKEVHVIEDSTDAVTPTTLQATTRKLDPAPPSLEGVVLVGLMVGDTLRQAFVDVDGAMRTLSTGDDVIGWKVLSISQNSMDLVFNDIVDTLSLYEDNPSKENTHNEENRDNLFETEVPYLRVVEEESSVVPAIQIWSDDEVPVRRRTIRY